MKEYIVVISCALFVLGAVILGSHVGLFDAGCVPAEELNAYQGQRKMICGWGVEKTVKFDRRLTLLDFGINTPPQSWCYTDYEITAFGQGRTAK